LDACAGSFSQRKTAGALKGLRPLLAEDRAAPAKVAEELFQQAFILGIGAWRCTADEVENLAVLKAVLSNALHHARLVEIDRDDAAVDLLRLEEGDLLGSAGDVIEGVTRP